ncbi:FUSC family protein [Neotabrizicola sp. sgz301269]|uniref:FUSC family protein n=1 Tax=Neotabrizicola sp. sgz301269 TaxID=3276282 RepID=UPI0037703032
MYVTPRPDLREDPNYGIRLGLTGALAYAAIPLLDPALPPIVAALPVGLIAAQRRAFDPAKLIGGVAAMIIVPSMMTWLVESLRPMPWAYVTVMWGLYFLGFLMILRSGAQAGMLLVVVTVLISVMGIHGCATVETLRDGIVQAALVALVVGPIVYLLVPARTKERHVDEPTPGQGNPVKGAAIRATILLGFSIWLYAVMQPSDMMMAVVAAMVLVFPTRQAVFSEAAQRVCATIYGSAVALGVLALFVLSQHLPIILGLIFLGGLWFGQKMLSGPQPSMVYQYAFSVMLALVAGALSTQDAGYAVFIRIVLTMMGAFAAAFAIALLDRLAALRSTRAETSAP